MRSRWLLAAAAAILVALLLNPTSGVYADNTYQPLPFSQHWSNPGSITVNDEWNGVLGIVGYRGDGLRACRNNHAGSIGLGGKSGFRGVLLAGGAPLASSGPVHSAIWPSPFLFSGGLRLVASPEHLP